MWQSWGKIQHIMSNQMACFVVLTDSQYSLQHRCMLGKGWNRRWNYTEALGGKASQEWSNREGEQVGNGLGTLFFIHAISNSRSDRKEMELKGIHIYIAMAFAHGLLIFPFSPELPFLNMQAKKCGFPEASCFPYTCSIASIFQRAMGSCMLLQFGFEKEILCFQTQKEDRQPTYPSGWILLAYSIKQCKAFPGNPLRNCCPSYWSAGGFLLPQQFWNWFPAPFRPVLWD